VPHGLLVALFVVVWVNFTLIEAVAALVAVLLLYKPLSGLLHGVAMWWTDTRTP